LQERAMSTEADMIVMGGYGHSRLREFVLGGAARDTLARTDIRSCPIEGSRVFASADDRENGRGRRGRPPWLA
jgi:hypothetical protein